MFSAATLISEHHSIEAHKYSNSVDVIFLDLRKAFDLVSHLKLLHKLKFYGSYNWSAIALVYIIPFK